MTHPPPEPGVLSRRRARPSRVPLLVLLLATLAVLAGLYAMGRPRLQLGNRLAGPVRLTVEGDTGRTLAPGKSATVPIPLGERLVITWELVRPLSADGRPMGEEVRGSVVVPARWGTVRRDATARGTETDYFAPLITNASNDLLRVTVNAGLQGALDCGCAVRPGARRTFIGYYRLYQNSTVQARVSGGRRAIFRELGSRIRSPYGTIGLRFESKDLRARD